MEETLFVCTQCGERHARYNFAAKTFDCDACRTRQQVIPARRTCPRCGYEYKEYTWFDPSGCVRCHKSFVD